MMEKLMSQIASITQKLDVILDQCEPDGEYAELPKKIYQQIENSTEGLENARARIKQFNKRTGEV